MASFVDPADALRAALEMRDEIARFNAEAGGDLLGLKVGLHSGACLAVTLNDRLDYFGQTVNIASRVQGLADAGEIVVTDDVLAHEGAAELVDGLPIASDSVVLRGVAGELLARRRPRAPSRGGSTSRALRARRDSRLSRAARGARPLSTSRSKRDDTDLELRALAQLGLARGLGRTAWTRVWRVWTRRWRRHERRAVSLETFADVCCTLMLRPASGPATSSARSSGRDVLEAFARKYDHVPLLAFCRTCCADVHAASGRIDDGRGGARGRAPGSDRRGAAGALRAIPLPAGRDSRPAGPLRRGRAAPRRVRGRPGDGPTRRSTMRLARGEPQERRRAPRAAHRRGRAETACSRRRCSRGSSRRGWPTGDWTRPRRRRRSSTAIAADGRVASAWSRRRASRAAAIAAAAGDAGRRRRCCSRRSTAYALARAPARRRPGAAGAGARPRRGDRDQRTQRTSARGHLPSWSRSAPRARRTRRRRCCAGSA